MENIYYKIGEVAEMLGIEQYTLRYLEHTLKLIIKRDERGDRLYSEADLDTLRLILKLKNEKGLNTTAIKMALNNMEETQETALQPKINGFNNTTTFTELNTSLNKIVEQNDKLIAQNKTLSDKIEQLEKKIEKRDGAREEKIDEMIKIWRNEQ